jgi:hypothetical protein
MFYALSLYYAMGIELLLSPVLIPTLRMALSRNSTNARSLTQFHQFSKKNTCDQSADWDFDNSDLALIHNGVRFSLRSV